jgi:hypothetical protein
LGSYLIGQEFENPLAAQSMGLLVAALLIATVITLLYLVVHPSRKSRRRGRAWPTGTPCEQRTVPVARYFIVTRMKHRGDLSRRARYVQPTRIRIQR